MTRCIYHANITDICVSLRIFVQHNTGAPFYLKLVTWKLLKFLHSNLVPVTQRNSLNLF